eukprot:485414-Amphidinium_carterae.1
MSFFGGLDGGATWVRVPMCCVFEDHVREAAERLLRPWRKAVQESEQAETVSLYTEGGTRSHELHWQLYHASKFVLAIT